MRDNANAMSLEARSVIAEMRERNEKLERRIEELEAENATLRQLRDDVVTVAIHDDYHLASGIPTLDDVATFMRERAAAIRARNAGKEGE